MKNIEELLCEQCPEGTYHFFNKLKKADLRFINENKIIRQYKKGSVIFSDGKKPQGVYCLREGKIKIFRRCYDGREQITRIVFPAEFMGIKAILSGNPYSVSASALEDSIVCFINKTYFFQLMVKYPDFTKSLIVTLSKLLEEAETRMVSLAHKPVRQRLAETLLFLNRSFHNTAPAYPRPYLNITRMDIANIIGTVPETVIRLLSEFKESGIIDIKGRKIFIIDIHRLQLTANLRD